MGTTGFADCRFRLSPLASCLAAALALASGAAGAAGRLAQAPDAEAALGRARAGDPLEQPGGWKRPDPEEIALRWQPVPHEIPPLPANSIVVQNCNDSGNGSLRDALNNANSGDTIDLTQLSCSTITLTTGSLLFTETTLTLQGPGAKYLSIDGNDAYAPLLHDGTGTLYINDLTVERGRKYFTSAQVDNARGGCIFSGGTVFLSSSKVDDCVVSDTDNAYLALGGGIYAYAGVSLSNSSITNSTSLNGWGGGVYSKGFVDVSDSFVAGNYAYEKGGGVYAGNGLNIKYSTIDSNHAGYNGGGAFGYGNVLITNSTISNNESLDRGGGLFIGEGSGATVAPTILSSTISGNNAYWGGGVTIIDYLGAFDARVANSTIAFNYERSPTKYGGGLYAHGPVDLESTIISGNTYLSSTSPDDVGGQATITGANNLIGYSTVPVPNDTILLRSAMLGPLASNGGTTRTHMILSGSPAIDAGNNAANVSFDQRGSGYPRVIGSSADIGAYELDTNDVIFVNGFDP